MQRTLALLKDKRWEGLMCVENPCSFKDKRQKIGRLDVSMLETPALLKEKRQKKNNSCDWQYFIRHILFFSSAGRSILASGSRDRLIHVLDANNDFRLISTLNIHSSSITVITICEISGQLNMISCSADRLESVDKVSECSHLQLRFTVCCCQTKYV